MPEKRVLKASRSPVRMPITHLDKLIVTGTDEEVTSELRKVFKDDVRSIGKYLGGVLPVGVAKNMVTFIKRSIREDMAMPDGATDKVYDGGDMSAGSPEEINPFSAETSYSLLMAGENDPSVAKMCDLLHERATRREINSLIDTIFYLLIHIDTAKLTESKALRCALSADVGTTNYGTTIRQLVNDFIDRV